MKTNSMNHEEWMKKFEDKFVGGNWRYGLSYNQWESIEPFLRSYLNAQRDRFLEMVRGGEKDVSEEAFQELIKVAGEVGKSVMEIQKREGYNEALSWIKTQIENL